MLSKVATFAVRRFINGPAKSWVFTSGAMMLMNVVKKQTGRRETLDLSSLKAGDKVVIEHLPITHKEQIKQFKRAAKDEKASAKVSRKSAKAAKKAGRKHLRSLPRAQRKAMPRSEQRAIKASARTS